MAQKTALTYFIEQLSLNLDITNFYESEDTLSSINKLNNLIDYAKQMEKEQIMNAYIDGELQQGFEAEAEQYYNETYK